MPNEFSDSLNCQDCGIIIDLVAYRRKTSLCDDCEFARLTPEGWENDFLERLNRWDFYQNHERKA